MIRVFSRRFAAQIAVSTCALLLSGCQSDGPAQTGGENFLLLSRTPPPVLAERNHAAGDDRFLAVVQGGGLSLPTTKGDFDFDCALEDEPKLFRVIIHAPDYIQNDADKALLRQYEQAVTYSEAYNDRLIELLPRLPNGVTVR